jgi:hypothetical protein
VRRPRWSNHLDATPELDAVVPHVVDLGTGLEIAVSVHAVATVVIALVPPGVDQNDLIAGPPSAHFG